MSPNSQGRRWALTSQDPPSQLASEEVPRYLCGFLGSHALAHSSPLPPRDLFSKANALGRNWLSWEHVSPMATLTHTLHSHTHT